MCKDLEHWNITFLSPSPFFRRPDTQECLRHPWFKVRSGQWHWLKLKLIVFFQQSFPLKKTEQHPFPNSFLLHLISISTESLFITQTLSKGTAISTEALKKFVSRRKWQVRDVLLSYSGFLHFITPRNGHIILIVVLTVLCFLFFSAL